MRKKDARMSTPVNLVSLDGSMLSEQALRPAADLARREQAHLILMATHGRPDVARTALGSVATETLRHSPVPLLLVRPQALGRVASPRLAGAGAAPQPVLALAAWG